MSARHDYERRFDRLRFAANLKAAICAQGFVLVMGTMLITNSRVGGELMFAVFFTAVQLAWAFFATAQYRLVCSAVAVPNLVIAICILVAFSIAGYSENAIDDLWFFSTLLLGLVAAILARAKGGGDESQKVSYTPTDDA